MHRFEITSVPFGGVDIDIVMALHTTSRRTLAFELKHLVVAVGTRVLVVGRVIELHGKIPLAVALDKIDFHTILGSFKYRAFIRRYRKAGP